MSNDSAITPTPTADWLDRLQASLRWLVVVTGGVAVAVALVVAVRPSTAALLPIAAIVGVLGSDYIVVAVLGILAVSGAVAVLGVRVRRGVTEATPPVVEGVQSAPYPGAAVDQTAGQSLLADDAAADPRERLREAAITATKTATDCSQAEARRRVDDGSWTTDQVASAWLAADRPVDDNSTATPPTTGDSSAPSKRTLSRTVSAITAVAGATDQPSGRQREPTEERR